MSILPMIESKFSKTANSHYNHSYTYKAGKNEKRVHIHLVLCPKYHIIRCVQTINLSPLQLPTTYHIASIQGISIPSMTQSIHINPIYPHSGNTNCNEPSSAPIAIAHNITHMGGVACMKTEK
ncbi:hypothetical protein AAMO2058_000462900 [Amorphochlora amoebiformis]